MNVLCEACGATHGEGEICLPRTELALEEGVREGVLERIRLANGECGYRLTQRGRERVEQMIREQRSSGSCPERGKK